MGLYQYKARDKSGKLIQGVVEANSEDAVASKLQDMGYLPVSITMKEAGEIGDHSGMLDRLKTKRVNFADLNMFTHLLFTLQKAGLPILSSLRAIKEQTVNKILKDTIADIITDVEGGASLSSALEKHPQTFNSLYVNMVRSGEISGKLSEILERLTVLGEHDEALRRQIKAAMRYPIMVVAAIIIAFLVLITFVVPRYESLFSGFNVALPLPTRILLGINYAVTKFWWATLIVIGALVFAFKKFIQTPSGRLLRDRFQLKVPIFGQLILKLFMSRFCRITGTLISSGVPILQILDLVSQSTENVIIAQTIKDIRVSVNEGKGMSGPMASSGVFPPIVIQMVAAGEETGKLDELLVHVSGYYDSQIDYTIKNLVSLIEPLLILFLGSAVLLMALGIFLPMWNLMSLFNG